VLSTPTFAENIANYSEGEVAWRIVRKLGRHLLANCKVLM